MHHALHVLDASDWHRLIIFSRLETDCGV